MADTRAYAIGFDGARYHSVVLATSFSEAIAKWTAYWKEQWGSDYDGTETPESVEKIDGVIIQ